MTICPLSAGMQLAASIPGARLHVVSGGTHDLAREHAAETGREIRRHLLSG
ncbi:alpha/beta fold hydrolase [Swaminathania salitolerans]|uniref:alpha/beta fold hydrolase n=1 Tax=Swaminathania salitolerans TaxID=182838 RepID=UPI001C99718E|nr:hypothetical protein [Swaminathania salitolerans]